MNNGSNKCSICGSKSRRLCLATDKMICTSCCGLKRGTQITCSSECRYYPFSINGYDLWLRIDDILANKMLDYVVANYGKDEFKTIIEDMDFDTENAEEMDATAIGSAVYYALFIKRNSDNKTLVEKWKAEGWPGLNNDECKMMECRINNSYATIIEIQRVLDHQAMECIDLFDEERGKFILLDRSTASRTTIRFTRLLTWLVHYPHFSRMAINEVSLKRKGLTIKEYLSENFGSFYKSVFELAHEKQLAMLNNMDMHQCKAFYEIDATKFDEVKAILDKYPDFEVREKHHDEMEFPGTYYYSWLRRGESKELEKEMLPAFQHKDESEGVGTIGNVSLYPRELVIETFSKQKYAFTKKMVDKYFGGLVTLKNEEVIDMAKQMAARIKEGRGGKRPSVKEAEEVPLEIEQTVMKNFYKKQYEKFLDEEIPALDGVTPRQAAEDPRMRPKLLDLMKEHLKGIERHNRNRNLGLDITWVLDELKLPELK
ncbi:MAG: hypothetical protein FD151_2244 [bacterium]|nr:MAG: hypothetical protein FD151_2244 [bacterium]